MPAEGLSSLGSLSGGVCGAAAALALALLAAARGAARQRLGVSAGDARLGVAVGAWPGEEGIDVQGANALPLLSASAAAEGAVALAAAAPAAVAAALAAVAATCKACTSTRRIRCRARQRLVVSAEFSARTGLLATACALSAAKRLRGVVLPSLPLRLVPRPVFLPGSRHCTAPGRLGASVFASARRESRIRRTYRQILPAHLVAPF